MTDSKAELAYQALEALLKTVSGLGKFNGQPYVSRTLEDPTRVSWDDCPAIFINETGEDIQPTKGFEGFAEKQTLTANLYLYVYQSDTLVAPVSKLVNNMVANIRAAIAPTDPQNSQTLNGTVSHCFIYGKIEIIEGIQDGQGIAILPVNILTNY